MASEVFRFELSFDDDGGASVSDITGCVSRPCWLLSKREASQLMAALQAALPSRATNLRRHRQLMAKRVPRPFERAGKLRVRSDCSYEFVPDSPDVV